MTPIARPTLPLPPHPPTPRSSSHQFRHPGPRSQSLKSQGLQQKHGATRARQNSTLTGAATRACDRASTHLIAISLLAEGGHVRRPPAMNWRPPAGSHGAQASTQPEVAPAVPAAVWPLVLCCRCAACPQRETVAGLGERAGLPNATVGQPGRCCQLSVHIGLALPKGIA